MNSFIKTILARPVGVVVCVMALIIFGVSTVTSMDLEKEPASTYPMLFVSAGYSGAGPEEIERLITTKLESACGSLKGFKDLTSSSSDGSCSIMISYDYGTDLKEAKEELQNAMANAKYNLPEGVDPQVNLFSTNDDPIFQAIVMSSDDDLDIRSIVKQQIEPALKKIEGVASVDVYGGTDRYISIELKPDAVAQYGLDVNSVASTISSAGFVTPAGSITYGDQLINISTSVTISTIEDIKNVPITLPSGAVLHLYDVANVRFLDAEETGFYRHNGHECVSFQIKKKQKENVVNLGKEIREVLEKVQKDFPEISITTLSDNSIPIQKSIQNIFLTLILGVVLSMLVLFLFFGDFKASMIVGSSMPLSLLVTFIMMGRMGYTLNLVTMSSLVIGIGMMVDNAIVVLEMCFVKKDTGLDYTEAAFEGTKFVFTDVVASTLTSVVVYLPLVNLKGQAGQQFGPLGWTIMFALTASLISALTIVPLAFSRYKPVEKKKLPINKLLDVMGRGYARLMPHILKHKFIAAAVMLALVYWAIQIFRMFSFDTSNYEFSDNTITLNMNFKPGISVDVVDDVAKHFEEFVSQQEGLEYYSTNVSSGSATIDVRLPDDSDISATELGFIWSAQLEEYDNRCELTVGYSFGGGGPSATIPLSSDSYDELKDALAKVEEIALSTPGVLSVKNDLRGGGFKAAVVFDRELALSRGFTSINTLADTISTQLQGKKAVEIIVDDRTFEARVELPKEMRSDISSVETMFFKNSDGAYIPFNEIGHIEYRNVPQTIERSNGRYSGKITATVATVEDLYRVQSAIIGEVKKMNLPKGVRLEESSAELETRAAVNETSIAIAAAVFLVFMVMAIQFESLRYSILVMICLPFALIGAMPLLYQGLDMKVINLSTMIGLLMLGGMVVNDGIMYVATTNEYRKTMPVHDALILAGRSRMRPILMTTLTTVLSMIPMVIPGAGGDPSMRGLAYVAIGGLMMATILTLIILPVFYLFLCKRDPKVPGDPTEKKRFGSWLRRKAQTVQVQAVQKLEEPDELCELLNTGDTEETEKEPEKPEKSGESEKTEVSNEPEKSEKPEEPKDSEKQEESRDPIKPDETEKPEEPEKSEESKESKESEKHGEEKKPEEAEKKEEPEEKPDGSDKQKDPGAEDNAGEKEEPEKA